MLTRRKPIILLILASIFMLFFMLQTFPLWTSEDRWAAVSWQMLWSGNYWHPYLYWVPYYDKPLLSYWLIVLCAKIFGSLNTFTLRFPSALAGLITIGCTYQLGKKLFGQKVGLLAGWMLITTYYFIFFSRVAFTDTLNIAGIMLAVLWYFYHKDAPRFFNYLVFFTICVITSLCKGLLGFVIPVLAIAPTLLAQAKWRKHLKISLLIAFLIALVVYLLPFIISTYHHTLNHRANGFYEVFRENIIRFFHPFDHENPLYIYFIYLPLYTLPWAIFLPSTIYSYIKNYKKYTKIERWPLIATIIVFVFLTASGSRRSYYVLPLVPFATLAMAVWLNKTTKPKITTTLIIIFYVLLALWFAIIQPIYYIKHNDEANFAQKIRAAAIKFHPWQEWQIRERSSEVPTFYANPKNAVKEFNLKTQLQNLKKELPRKVIWIISTDEIPIQQTKLPKYTTKPYVMLKTDGYVVIIWK